MATNNPNLALWNAVRSVPKDAQKNFNNGSFSGTDINPAWRMEQLTLHFGVCGFGWYYEIAEIRKEQVGNETITYCRINLFVKDAKSGEWSKPIVGVGGNRQVQQFSKGAKVSDEDEKMALTDALGVACKALGIGADVYYASERTKYTQNTPEEMQGTKGHPDPVGEKGERGASVEMAIKEVQDAKSTEELGKAWNKWKSIYGKETALLKAVKESPFNPNNGRSK